MAKHVILEGYTFTPSTNTIKINNKYVRPEQLLLITNVTRGTVVYNFSDPSLGFVTCTPTVVNGTESTTLVLSYSTAAMSASDKLSILVEETYNEIVPAETFMDPVGKMRVSTPQALIDTDFEYGSQPTKWESLVLVNNRPSSFNAPETSGTQFIYNAGTASQSTTTVTGVGTVFHGGMIGSRFVYMDGTDVGVITAVASGTSLTVSVSATVSSQSYAIYGYPYKGGSTSPSTTQDPSIMTNSGTTVTLLVNTGAVNVYPGQPITILNSSDQANVDGTWVVDTVTPQAAYAAAGAGVNDSITFKVLNTPTVFYAGTSPNLFDPTKTQIFLGNWATASSIPVTSVVAATTTATVTTTNAHGLNVGQHVHMTNLSGTYYNGTFIVATTPTNNTFTYTAASGATTGTLTWVSTTAITGPAYGICYPRSQGYVIHRAFDGGVQFAAQAPYHGVQAIRQTRRYFRYQSGKGIQFSTGTILRPAFTVDSITAGALTIGSTVTVTCKYPHGMVYSSTGTNPQVRVSNVIDVSGYAFGGTASQTTNTITGVGTNFVSSMIGQTFVFADGTVAGTISAVGSTTSLTVSTSQTVASQSWYVQSAGYNGTFTISGVTSPYVFTYVLTTAVTSTTGYVVPGTNGFSISPASWYGGKNRVGLFDQQNGFFFEHDGQTLWTVRRNSTQQISGTVTVTQNSQSVVGINTAFADQLNPGDNIVIRGQSYTVGSITSQTQMYIYPEYRGATPLNASYVPQSQSNVVVSKTVDLKIPQSQWNIDKCDGTGASGYNVDLTKMQMLYIDFSWYGAGAIRFGFKNNRGEVIYANRIANNNRNTEAYMRSGNMAARYETNTLAPFTKLTSTLSSGSGNGSTISVADTTGFPPSGTLVITASGATSAVTEYISYSAITGTSFTINARAQTGGQASAQTFTYSVTAPIKIELYAPSIASTVSHWGSSVIMDGRYDDDKSIVFSAGMNNIFTFTARQQYPLISIRIAPSVDSGLSGFMGAKEIINRMQLILRQMDAQTVNNAFAVDLWLNAAIASGYSYGSAVTAGSNTITTAGTTVGTAFASGNYIYGPGIVPGTVLTSSTGLSIPAFTTKTGITLYCSANNFQSVGGSSLAQRFIHATTDRLIPGTGEKIFTFFTNSSGVTQQDLSQVRDLATSILGGAPTNAVPAGASFKYPDGPDVITMIATPLGTVSNATIIARLSWTEAQA